MSSDAIQRDVTLGGSKLLIRRLLSGCLIGLFAILLVAALLVTFVWYEQTIQTVQLAIRVGNLPMSLNGIRIGLISDLHIGSHMSTSRVADIVRRLNTQEPDVVVIAGDTVDAKITEVSGAAASLNVLRQIQAPLGKYLVFGNHDQPRSNLWRPLLQKAGVHVLENEHVRLGKSSDVIYLVGLADVYHGTYNIAQAWRGVPKNSVVIAAVHEPDVADSLTGIPMTLQLSGHSHGGQIRIPYRPMYPPLGERYPLGLQRAQSGHLVYTTRGLGTSHIPLRLFARPEITIITLSKR